MFDGQGVLVLSKFSTTEVSKYTLPKVEFTLCTESENLGGHLPCVAYDRQALEIWAFRAAHDQVCKELALSETEDLEVRVRGWLYAHSPTGDYHIIINNITFWVPRQVRTLAKQYLQQRLDLETSGE